jgi:MarR family 2-MHQ and catechol resistance regulon transcriptional repressor
MPGKSHLNSRGETNATHVWLVLWKAARAIGQNAVNSVSSLGLGLSDFAVLEVLLHKGAQPVNVIGKSVLLTSGYNEVEAVRRFTGKELAGFIQKPYSSATLTEKVRSLFEEPFR